MSRYRTAIVVLGVVMGAVGALTACGALEPDDLFAPGPDGGDAASNDTGAGADALLDAKIEASMDANIDAGVDASTDSAADAFADSDSSPISPFVLTTNASQVYVVRGSQVQVPLTLVASGGFLVVLVLVSGLPDGITADPLTLSSATPTAMLTLHATTAAALGIGQLGITAVADGPVLSPVLSLPIIVQDPSGMLDQTFGTNGIATLKIPDATLSGIPGKGLVVQPDGKIAFAGVVNYNNLLVGRFTADGNLDISFGTSGLYTTNQSEYFTEVAFAIRALPAGGLVTAGFGISDPESELWSMVVTKFLDDGSLDTSFGGGAGFVGIQAGDTNAEALDLVIQPDGKLVMGGFQPAGTSALVRLTADGLADSTFEPATGTSAIAANTYPTAGSCINAIGLLPSGEILAATQIPSGGANAFLGFQFTSQGVLETSYGTGGTASAPVSSPLNGWLPGGVGMVVQPGGMSVQAGSTSSTIELARFTTGGQLDTTFGPNMNGQVSTSIPGSSTVTVSSIALTPDGGFVVATHFANATPIGVVRYTASGALDTAFAGTGYTGFSGGAAASGTEAVAVNSVGRILVAAALDGTVNVARFWP